MKIAVVAGTSEATELIKRIENIYDVTAFTATEYGAEILNNCNCHIHTGRLDEYAFSVQLRNFDIVADATHPFAVEVSRILKKVCSELGIAYLRILRKKSEYKYQNIVYVSSKEEASEVLCSYKGNILLTTGANTLEFYKKSVSGFKERVWARVLDTEVSRRISKNAGCHVIYAVPPFSRDDTLDLLKKYNISVLVSKDSGEAGGVPEKLEACEILKIPVIIIRRPDETEGISAEEAVRYLLALASEI